MNASTASNDGGRAEGQPLLFVKGGSSGREPPYGHSPLDDRGDERGRLGVGHEHHGVVGPQHAFQSGRRVEGAFVQEGMNGGQVEQRRTVVQRRSEGRSVIRYERSYTSSMKSLNQPARTMSTYAARNGTMGTIARRMSTAMTPMAMSQICWSEMVGQAL